jgi:hypothetical protein
MGSFVITPEERARMDALVQEFDPAQDDVTLELLGRLPADLQAPATDLMRAFIRAALELGLIARAFADIAIRDGFHTFRTDEIRQHVLELDIWGFNFSTYEDMAFANSDLFRRATHVMVGEVPEIDPLSTDPDHVRRLLGRRCQFTCDVVRHLMFGSDLETPDGLPADP